MNIPQRLTALLGVVGVLLLVGGVAVASIPDASGVIHGCRKNNDGSLRVIDSDAGQTCPNGWTALNWSQTGPAGPAGVSGYEYLNRLMSGPASSATPFEGFIYCSPGKRPLGGGAIVHPLNGTVRIVGTAAFSEEVNGVETPVGWNVYAAADSIEPVQVDIDLYVQCANVS